MRKSISQVEFQFEWQRICKKLKNSGYDLNKIQITCKENSTKKIKNCISCDFFVYICISCDKIVQNCITHNLKNMIVLY